MAGASFTKGPWVAHRYVGDADNWFVRGSGNTPVCGQGSGMVGEANARLIAAAPDYATACGLDLHPGEAQSCGPLSWLRTAIDTLSEDAVREAAQGDDPDAYWTMLTECRVLVEKLEAANAKAGASS